MKLYVFGNPLVKKDSAALNLINKVKKSLPQLEYVNADPNENFPPTGETDLLIIDTVVGIKKPLVLDIENLKKINKSPVSPHDYDLLFHLLLLKKIGRLERVRILGIPVGWRKVEPVIQLISGLI